VKEAASSRLNAATAYRLRMRCRWGPSLRRPLKSSMSMVIRVRRHGNGRCMYVDFYILAVSSWTLTTPGVTWDPWIEAYMHTQVLAYTNVSSLTGAGLMQCRQPPSNGCHKIPSRQSRAQKAAAVSSSTVKRSIAQVALLAALVSFIAACAIRPGSTLSHTH
jgi:hypothetical protein